MNTYKELETDKIRESSFKTTFTVHHSDSFDPVAHAKSCGASMVSVLSCEFDPKTDGHDTTLEVKVWFDYDRDYDYDEQELDAIDDWLEDYEYRQDISITR